MSDKMQELHQAARFIPRLFGPFVNVSHILLEGVRLDYQLETTPNPPTR
jgi:hypothetical protein